MIETLTTNSDPRSETGYRFLDEKGEHVHLLNGQPLVGTSQIGNVLAKPLAWYGSGKAVEVFGCPNPKVLTKIKNKKATRQEINDHLNALEKFMEVFKTITLEEYGKLIDKAYRAHDTYKRERAVVGTDVHAECERFVKDWMRGMRETYDPQIHPFIEWADKNVMRFLWSEGHCYSKKHWLGGISDAGYESKDGKFGILDFKSTKEAYISQFWQCAGYDLQISENGVLDKDGNVILPPMASYEFNEYCIFAFGGDKPQPYFFSDPKGAQEAFLACLLIYNKLPKE
jgi:hypothetical protein